MIKRQWNIRHNKFRIVCTDCGWMTFWFYKAKMPVIHETVESWTDYWKELHRSVQHP